jgi:hypothetical protein
VTSTVYLTLTMTKGEKIPMSTAEVPDVDEKVQHTIPRDEFEQVAIPSVLRGIPNFMYYSN